jgi:hypothetical protein
MAEEGGLAGAMPPNIHNFFLRPWISDAHIHVFLFYIQISNTEMYGLRSHNIPLRSLLTFPLNPSAIHKPACMFFNA